MWRPTRTCCGSGSRRPWPVPSPRERCGWSRPAAVPAVRQPARSRRSHLSAPERPPAHHLSRTGDTGTVTEPAYTLDSGDALRLLRDGELDVEGRLVDASN